MTTAKDLRSWLMTQPRPTTVRLSLADGRVEELACAGQPWARLGESCAAMDPVTVFAIDPNGKLLRAAKVADIAEGIESDDETPQAPAASGVYETAPAKLERNDSLAMLAVLDKFGSLLANAYAHSTDVAFTKMVELVTMISNTLAQMQRELMQARLDNRRLEREIIDDALDQAEAKAEASGDGDMFRQFIGSYMSGAAERFAQQATSAVAGGAAGVAGGKPNGKAAPPPPQPKGS